MPAPPALSPALSPAIRAATAAAAASEAGITDSEGESSGQQPAASSAALSEGVLVLHEELVDLAAKLQLLIHSGILDTDAAQKLVANIKSLVLKLTSLQSIRFEIRLLGNPLHPDGNAALKLVHNKSLVFDVNRTGDKLKQKLSIKPASQLAPKGVQQEGRLAHILPDKARNER